MWGVLVEDDSAPGGDVLTRWGSVSNRPELAAEFQFLLFRCWAGHFVAEKSPVAVVSGLGFQCAREERVGRGGLGTKGGKSEGWWAGRQFGSRYGWCRVPGLWGDSGGSHWRMGHVVWYVGMRGGNFL